MNFVRKLFDPCYVKVINLDRYPNIKGYDNCGNYPYNVPPPNNKGGYKKYPNTLKYNNETFNDETSSLEYTTIRNVFDYRYDGNTLCIVKPMENAKITQFNICNQQCKWFPYKFKTDKLYIEREMQLWNVETFEFLIEQGVDIRDYCYKFLDMIIDEKAYLDIYTLKFLMKQNVNLYLYQEGLLVIACKNGELSSVKYLIEDIGRKPIIGISNNERKLFNEAIKNNHFHIIKYLVEYTINSDLLECFKQQILQKALHCAVEENNLQIKDYLIKNGAKMSVSRL